MSTGSGELGERAEVPGIFVVLEGGDGVGKSSQAGRLAERLTRAGREVLLTREPGDTPLGARVRELLLHEHDLALAPRTEALLYAADKAQHLAEVVRPALDRGAVVVCDRYVDSMLAYQGAGRVLVDAEVEQIARWATEDLRPDLAVLLDLDPAEAVSGIVSKDRLESEGLDFHRRVREGFLALAARDRGHYLVLPARQDRAVIADQIWQRLQPLLAPGVIDAQSPGAPTAAGDGTGSGRPAVPGSLPVSDPDGTVGS